MTGDGTPGGWDDLAGMTCTCPPECTTGDVWGDGPRECLASCRPCRVMQGKPYVKRRKTKAKVARERTSVFERPTDDGIAS